MAKFCATCGAPLAEGTAFCAQCGASANPGAASSTQSTLVTSPPPPIAAAATSSSPVLKILLGVVAFLFIFGALVVGGLYYAAHRASQKLHEVADRISGGTATSAAGHGITLNGGASGNVNYCRLLSKDDVSRAIGVEIVDMHQTDAGCEYLAHGNSADMTAKHAAALVGARGAPAEQQKQIEQFASGIFNSTQSEPREPTEDANGNSVVLAFGIDPNSARAQLHLNKKVLGGLGPGSQPIAGIGDEAFDAAGGMMMVRKGDKLVRIMYTSCPCSTDAIKPLARKLADAL